MHWLHLCSGGDSMVQEPHGGLLRILQVLVFTYFQYKIQEEENQLWKRPEAQV
jgi:protein-S-isoprenylcysteine O-methyltransferase Ste14